MRSRGMANRLVLVLAGLVLVAAGAAAARWGAEQVVIAGLGRLQRTDDSLLLAASCAGLAGSLALLTAQITRPAPRLLPVPGFRLTGRAVRHAAQAACSAVPGVVGARCRLVGRERTKGLTITLTVDSTADPGDILAAVSYGVVPQIAPLLAPCSLHTRIRLRVRRPRPHRAL
ncbi:hypothetical protein [Streptomyces anulatus]|uniref:hypothetical protein n=1 Tax=Streptomyces anulatus TaxID=1892 RepID=UPI002F908086|nr:hypothetical protein OG865_39355 [Streptomyces anulatus]